MDTAIVLLGSTLVGVGVVWLAGVWLREHLGSRWSLPERPEDHAQEPSVRFVIRAPQDTYIPIPEALTTKDEMVAWMTRDLPKLVREKQGPGSW
jgi:hypothetical protein